MNVAEWITAFGEVLIAAVIVLEMEENRRERFLSEAGNIRNYEDRGAIYSAFYDIAGKCVGEKSKTFCEYVWKQEEQYQELKKSCERQIVLFGRLGQIQRRALFFRGDYVKLFPHAVVLFWIMVEPYIMERRAMTGTWWATDFEELTRKCLAFLLKDPNARLVLYDRDRRRKEDFVVPRETLRDLQHRLKPPKKKRRSR